MFFPNPNVIVKSLIPVSATAIFAAAIAWFAAASGNTINQTNNDALYAEQRVAASQEIVTHMMTISRARPRTMLFLGENSLESTRDLIQDRTAKINALANDLSTNIDKRLRESPAHMKEALTQEKSLLNNILTPWKDYEHSLVAGTLPRIDSMLKALHENQNIDNLRQTSVEAIQNDSVTAGKMEAAAAAYSSHLSGEASRLSAIGDTATEKLEMNLWLSVIGAIIVSSLITFAFSYEKYKEVKMKI